MYLQDHENALQLTGGREHSGWGWHPSAVSAPSEAEQTQQQETSLGDSGKSLSPDSLK